jgi:phosphate transport system permease protein
VADKPNPFRRRRAPAETAVSLFLQASAIFSVLVTIGIIAFLISESILFCKDPAFRPFSFFTGRIWQPTIGKLGALPLLNSTFLSVGIALAFATPLGFFIAVYIYEYASKRLRSTIRPALELLAGLPTIVLAYFAISFLTPFLRNVLGPNVVETYNVFSAGIAMGILVLPLFITMAEDAFHAVPKRLKEAPYTMGATRWECFRKVILPPAFPSLISAFIFAMSRAVGESVIVALAAGAGPNFTFNPFKAAETITGYIMRISGGDLGYDTMDYNSIFALGLVLFIVTLSLNIVAKVISLRNQKDFEL